MLKYAAYYYFENFDLKIWTSIVSDLLSSIYTVLWLIIISSLMKYQHQIHHIQLYNRYNIYS